MTRSVEYRLRADLRAESRGGARRLVGFAARYGVEADIGLFRERIAPGAFAGSLGGDILALFDHDPRAVLGRTRSGTLKLDDAADGLAFDLSVADTSAGRDALALAERGDLGGASIGFFTEEEEKDGGVRVVKRATLVEISIVSSWPAYGETSVEARRGGGCLHPAPGQATPRRDAPRRAMLSRYLDTV